MLLVKYNVFKCFCANKFLNFLKISLNSCNFLKNSLNYIYKY